jgi:hypothetical protein
MRKTMLAVLALVLGALALFYCTLMLADLVSGRWWYGLGAAAASFATGGGAYTVLGLYLKASSKRRRGGDDDGKADDGRSRSR